MESLERYCRDIAEIPLLTRKEEIKYGNIIYAERNRKNKSEKYFNA
jgi:hypothetical protein